MGWAKICQFCGKVFPIKSQTRLKKAKFCSQKCHYESRKIRIFISCENCGKTIKIFPSKKERRFCSRECFFEWRKKNKKRFKRVCKTCGKKFFVVFSKTQPRNGSPRGLYCSKKCRLEKPSKKIKKRCLYCGKVFRVNPAVNKRGEGKFCSRECFVKSLKGKGSHFWKGGISFEPYCPLFNEEFKERVREFWDRKCGLCGKKEINNGKKLNVHHVQYDKDTCCNNTLPLFIPLCNRCHTKTNFNRSYWEEMFSNYIMIWYDGECYENLL